jgi:Phosphoglucose isomerase
MSMSRNSREATRGKSRSAAATRRASGATRALPDRPAWRVLAVHARKLSGRHLRERFAEDPTRGERLTAEGAGLFLDYSKNRVPNETLALLVRLAEESDLCGRIDAMFSGQKPKFQATWPSASSARAPSWKSAYLRERAPTTRKASTYCAPSGISHIRGSVTSFACERT